MSVPIAVALIIIGGYLGVPMGNPQENSQELQRTKHVAPTKGRAVKIQMSKVQTPFNEHQTRTQAVYGRGLFAEDSCVAGIETAVKVSGRPPEISPMAASSDPTPQGKG